MGRQGVAVMSHHRTIYIASTLHGGMVPIGYVRITNDDKVLSIWIQDQGQLFHPEEVEE